MKPSRRIMLQLSAVGVAFVATPWALRASRAQAKAGKKAMQYQDQPKNGQECDTCALFVPGPNPGGEGSCKVVEGPISPKGWCVAYSKKS